MSEALPANLSASRLRISIANDRQLQLRIAAGAGLVALGVSASDDDGPILCPFRRCTSGYCPLCGATRSFGRLIRGDVVGAWVRHPFVVLLTLQVVVVGAVVAFRSSRNRPRVSSIERRWFLVGNATLAIGLWLTRMMLGDVPHPSTLSFFGL